MAPILIGPSGAGKSTFSAGALVVSADFHFMKDGGYRFDPSKLGDAHAACLRAWIEGVQGGHGVVCDNTNTTLTEIAPYMATAIAYGCDVEVIAFVADPEQVPALAARNKHGVPEAVIRGQIARIADTLKAWPSFWPAPTVLKVRT